MSELNRKNHFAKSFGKIADDFFFNLLLIKTFDKTNRTIPFLYAHILELSVKAYCISENIDYSDIGGHAIIKIYKRIAETKKELNNLLPTAEDFVEYKKTWVPTYNREPNSIELPNEPEILELAFILDNIMDLKYGFKKDFLQLSTGSISFDFINRKFLDLFNYCRDIYKTEELNSQLKTNFFKVFGQNQKTEEYLKSLINF